MSQFTDALRILAKIAEDRRNWEAGMSKIEELLKAAEAADAALSAHETRRAQLVKEVARLENETRQHQESVSKVKARLDGFNEELGKREAAAQARLGALDEQIKASEEKLANANEALARLAALAGAKV